MLQTYTDGPYKTFTAAVPANLVGKENYIVEQLTDGTIQLLTTGLAIGVLHNRLENGSDWTVRLLGKGGTVKVKCSGAIATSDRTKGASGGTLVTLGASGRSLGIKVSPVAASASGDVVEIIDVIEVIA